MIWAFAAAARENRNRELAENLIAFATGNSSGDAIDAQLSEWTNG